MLLLSNMVLTYLKVVVSNMNEITRPKQQRLPMPTKGHLWSEPMTTGSVLYYGVDATV